MKTCLFQKSTVIDAPIEAVYAFHENPHNLPVVSPPGLRVKEIAASEEAVKGETFEIVASQFLVPIRWEGVWDEANHPTLLVDRALRSPFARFRHSHQFESIDLGSRTRMTDRVEYALPGGELGFAVGQTFVRLALAVGFVFRHRVTRAWFAGNVGGNARVRSALAGRLGLVAGGLAVGALLFLAWHRRRR